MIDKSKPGLNIAQVETSGAIASGQAPFLYFEAAPQFGLLNGVGQVTLTASRLVRDANGIASRDEVFVAHLRGNLAAVRSLRKALDGILQMAEPVPDGPKN